MNLRRQIAMLSPERDTKNINTKVVVEGSLGSASIRFRPNREEINIREGNALLQDFVTCTTGVVKRLKQGISLRPGQKKAFGAYDPIISRGYGPLGGVVSCISHDSPFDTIFEISVDLCQETVMKKYTCH